MRGWRDELVFKCPICDAEGEHMCLPGLYMYIKEHPEVADVLRDFYVELADREMIPTLEELYDWHAEADEQD